MNKGLKLAIAETAVLVAEPVLALAGLAAGAVAYLVADEIHQATRSEEGEPSSSDVREDTRPVGIGLIEHGVEELGS